MSVNPTQYDVIQDARIEDVESLVKNEYNPPSALEYSYPVVDQPMNDEMWQFVTLAFGNGIMDEGGQPYWLRNLNNATNTATLTTSTTTLTAQAVLRGFYHRLLRDLEISLPPVTVDTTYYVILQYDPVGHQQPTGPIKVKVVTQLDISLGKFYAVMWTVERKPNQLLTDAKVTQGRQKVAPTITVDGFTQLPEPRTVLWGTHAFVSGTTSKDRPGIYVASGASAETGAPTEWREANSTGWTNLTLGTGFVAAFSTPQWRMKDGYFEFRGSIKRSNDADFATGYVTLGWTGVEFPHFFKTTAASSGFAPRIERRAGSSGVNDNLTMYNVTSSGLKWVSIDLSIPYE